MPTEILMPALSPTMEEGKLAKWLVKEGQTIKPGDIIAEIETDKATMEVEAVDEGKVSKLLVAEGTEGVKVNAPIAVLLAEGEKDGAPTVAKAPSAPARDRPRARRASASGSPPLCGEGRGGGDRRPLLAWLPPPLAPPHKGEGKHMRRGVRANQRPRRTGMRGSRRRRWRGGWRGRRGWSWRRWRAAGRTGASSSAISRRPFATAWARRRPRPARR